MDIADYRPLKSIVVPQIGSVEPKGLVLVVGPNSSGKTQFLRDIQGRMLGSTRQLVVCESVAVEPIADIDLFLSALLDAGHIRRRIDENNVVYLEPRIPELGGGGASWSHTDAQVRSFHNQVARHTRQSEGGTVQTNKVLELFGRSFLSSLFLDRRLTLTNTVDSFDYETQSPSNELQALHIDSEAKRLLDEEARRAFGRSIWLDVTRGGRLCLRVGAAGGMPPAEDRLEPEKMKEYRLIEDEGDGFKSYMGICVTLLLGRRPVVLIDEPEMCLHPPQAYALGRFIGKYGVSQDHATFVATHSSHLLRGIIEATDELQLVRLSRREARFSGRRVSSSDLLASTRKPSTKAENMLDGIFAEAIAIVESEGDRLVYSAAWNQIKHRFALDVQFVAVGGLGGIADACRFYRGLEIPVCAIADLDAICEEVVFSNIVAALRSGDDGGSLVGDAARIRGEVGKRGPELTEQQTVSALKDIASERRDWKDPEQVRRLQRELRSVVSGLSSMSIFKNGGRGLGGEVAGLNEFLADCQGIGLFLVPVGELEHWVPDLMTEAPGIEKKGLRANYMARRIGEVPPRSDDVWRFLIEMATFLQSRGLAWQRAVVAPVSHVAEE